MALRQVLPRFNKISRKNWRCMGCGHDNEDIAAVCSNCMVPHTRSLVTNEKPSRLPGIGTPLLPTQTRGKSGNVSAPAGDDRCSNPTALSSDDDDALAPQTTLPIPSSTDDEGKAFFDWTCSRCHRDNNDDDDVCIECRANRPEPDVSDGPEDSTSGLAHISTQPPAIASTDSLEPEQFLKSKQIDLWHLLLTLSAQEKAKRIRLRCQSEGGHFRDGFQTRVETENSVHVEWRRAREIVSLKNSWPDKDLLQNAKSWHVKQGGLGNCWFVSGMSSLPDHPVLLNHVVVTKEVNEEGVYAFLLCKWGVRHVVIVDDYLPCDPDGRLLYSQTEHLWAALLEKAMAVLHRAYEALNSGLPLEGITALTGFPCDTFFLESSDGDRTFTNAGMEDDSQWPTLLRRLSAGCLTSASTGVRTDASFNVMTGLSPTHAYSVVNAGNVVLSDGTSESKLPESDMELIKALLSPVEAKKESANLLTLKDVVGRNRWSFTDFPIDSTHQTWLLKLRNPHGVASWKGEWGDGSHKWGENPELKARLRPYCFADGTFWINYDDFSRNFNRVDISKQYGGGWHTLGVWGRFSGPSGPPVRALILTVQEETEVDFSAVRQADRTLELDEPVLDGCVCVFRSDGSAGDGSFSAGSLLASAHHKVNCPMTCSCVLKPGEKYLVVCLSFQNWPAVGVGDQNAPLSYVADLSRYVLTMHSRRPLLLETRQLTDGSLADAVIKLVMEEGERRLRPDVPVAVYSLARCGIGTIVVVENRRHDADLQVFFDCSLSDRLTSTRGDLRTTDVIPSRCRQIVQVLLSTDSDSKLPPLVPQKYHFADVENSDSWLPPDVRHEPALEPEMESLHLPRPMRA